MAASEVAIALLISNSLHELSRGRFLFPGLYDQINEAISHLRETIMTPKLLQSGSDNDQQSGEHGSGLLDLARDAVDSADMFFLEASPHLKSHKGRLAKIRALVHFMSLRMRIFTTKKVALNFVTRVQELSVYLSKLQQPHPSNRLTPNEDGSSKNAHRGNVRWKGKVESDILGREVEAGELLAQLNFKDGHEDEWRLRIVSVVGEEAIGKTALVRSVYNRLEIHHRFQCRVWVDVPKEFTLKGILVKIMKQTPVQELKNLEDLEEEKLKDILHKSLMELRYLIVFDNLREAWVMDELMILLADSKNGSRVIVTTQDRTIPSIIDNWTSPIELNELGAEQRELLLGQCGSIGENRALAARILRNCGGFPPRILLIGGLVAASADSSPVMEDLYGDEATLDRIVSLSYHKLPSQLKLCLLYLCLFPEDMEISTRRLFRLWSAEGLVKAHRFMASECVQESVESCRFTAKECFEELVDRNLVHVVRRKLGERPKSCRLPSFLQGFLCKRATQSGLLDIHSDTMCTHHDKDSKAVNSCSWFVKCQDNNYPQVSEKSTGTKGHRQGNIQLQNLRSYVSFRMQKRGTRSQEVEELLRPLLSKGHYGLLRVLDLEGIYKPLLPDGFGNILPNMRYLGLRWTVLDSIPESVGNMSLLETLDLKHTNVRNLPSSIWKVKSLQHLYMNEVCFDKSTSCHKLSPKYLSNLQTLWGLYIGAAKSAMLTVLSNSTRLEKLGLTCNSVAVGEVTTCISKLTMLQSLKLRSRDLFGQPSDLNLSNMTGLEKLSDLYLLGRLPTVKSLTLQPKLKILTLSMSGLADDQMSVLGKLKSLEILNLFAGSYTGEELNCHSGSFPGLRVLKLWKLDRVQKISVDETALRQLEELEIKNCGLLTSVDSLDQMKSLKQISLIKVNKKLKQNIKGRKLKGVFVIEKQLVTSSSSTQGKHDDQ